MRILLAAILTRFRLLCSSEHVIGRQEEILLDFRDADALFYCQRLISQALPTHLIPAHAKTKQISFVVFCSAATGPFSVHIACSGRVTPLL
jgi:hypothetical protein